MRIIDNQTNKCFNSLSNIPIVQLISGPVRAVAGIAQFVINLIGSIFLYIPSRLGHIDETSSFHANHLFRDSGVGLLHTARGLFETIPFAAFIYNLGPDGNGRAYVDDRPFSFPCRDEDPHEHCSMACK